MKKLLISLLLLPYLCFGQLTGKIISNKPTGGTISADTINAFSLLNLHQTTDSKIISLANLTSGAKTIYVRNTGSTSVTLSPGGFLDVGKMFIYGWMGSYWSVTGSGVDTSIFVKKKVGDILFNYHSSKSFDITNDGDGGDYSNGYLYFSNIDVELGWGINYISFPSVGGAEFHNGGATVVVPTSSGTLALTSQVAEKLDSSLVSGKINIGQSYGGAAAKTPSLNSSTGSFSLSNAGVFTFPDASGSGRGFLNSSDWTTFNNKAAANQTMYIGTTAVSINRVSGALALTGIASIDGNAATVTTIPALSNEVSNSGNSVTLVNDAVIQKLLTGYSAAAGTVSSSDNILQAIQKLDGNISAAINGLQIKQTATVATAAALPSNTYNNSTGTITGLSLGVLTVDGYSVVLNDYVLVKNESTDSHNGLYKCTTAGTAGVLFVLTRATDMNVASEFSGAFIPVSYQGAVNSNSLWLCNPVGTVTLGTTSIPFTQLNGATDLVAGSGIGISGNTISVNNPLNQNTTGSAAYLTTPRSIYGNNFDGTAALTQAIAGTYGGTGINNGSSTFTYGANTTITGGGTLGLGGFTLTVPATGTADLLGTEQTFTADKTFTTTGGTTSLLSGSSTLNLFNATPTTINFGGNASTALNIGHASGTNTILGASTFSQAAKFSSTINKITFTAPASSATLTLANSSSFITSGGNSLTLTTTGTTNATFKSGTTTVADNADLATALSIYRSLRQSALNFVAGISTAGTYYMIHQGNASANNTNSSLASGAATSMMPAAIYIAAADYPSVNGLVPKLRIRANLFVNHTAPTGTYTFALYPLTTPASSGGAALRSWTIGTLVSGSDGATISAPSADSQNNLVSADFSLPADGLYVIGIVNSAIPATNSFVECIADLQITFK